MRSCFKTRKCFLCGNKVVSCGENPKPGPGHKVVFQAWIDSCVQSVSEALNLSLDPSLGRTMSRLAKYCVPCTTLIRDIDFLVQTLNRLRKDLRSKSVVLEGVIRVNYGKLGRSSRKQGVPGSYEFEVASLYKSLAEAESTASAAADGLTDDMDLVQVKEEYDEDVDTLVADSEPVKVRQKKRKKRKRAEPAVADVEHESPTFPNEESAEIKEDECEEDEPQTKVRFSRSRRQLSSVPRHRDSDVEVEAQNDEEDYCPSEIDSHSTDENGDLEADCESGTDNENCASEEGVRKNPARAVKSKVRQKKQKCPQAGCQYFYYKDHLLASHTRKVHEGDPKPFHCQVCSKKYASMKSFYDHRREHTGKGLLTCAHCGRTFNNIQHFKRHGTICTQAQPASRKRSQGPLLSCTYTECDFSGSELALMVHVRSLHLGQPNNYACSVCEAEFRYPTAYRIHMRIHRGDEPAHKCSFCPRAFWTRGALTQHVKLRHFLPATQTQNLEPVAVFSCPACLKLFISESDRDGHMVLHDRVEHPFTCVFCQAVYTSFIDLKNHVRQVHEEGIPQCSLCLKTFKTPKSLEKHVCGMKRPSLTCKSCGFVGINLQELTKHRLAEHGGNFMCQVCGRLYIDKYSLKKHERLHTGDLHLKCSLCPKAFNTHSKVKEHEKTHWTEISFFCPKCNKGFKTDKSVKQHSRRFCSKGNKTSDQGDNETIQL